MFNTTYSVNFTNNQLKSGTLYSKLETSVVAAFNPDGKIKPLYFQYTDFCSEDHSVKIESILSSKEDHYAGLPIIVYSCIANIQDKQLPCTLRYHVSEHYWELLY